MIYHADCRSIPLPDGCVQCVITSPPYFGLRDYGVEGQIGLEATPEAYLDTMVAVFREIKRVLRDDGTVWLNVGDSYAHNGACGGGSPDGPRKARETDRLKQQAMKYRVPEGLKPKDLMGMPWRLAFALQADGWYLRSDIIWAKPNPMPESVTDRPTRSHEYIFLLTKRSSYYYDADAIREPQVGAEFLAGKYNGRHGVGHGNLNNQGHNGNGFPDRHREYNPAGRNRRDVWTIPSQATPEAHFATFPEKLVEPCVLAGTSAKGCCSECGAPYVRETEVGYTQAGGKAGSALRIPDKNNWDGIKPRLAKHTETLGWRATCTHDAAIQPCLVFDPFGGSGTVGVVCERLGRRWAMTELSEAYIKIAEQRTCQQGLFSHAIAD